MKWKLIFCGVLLILSMNPAAVLAACAGEMPSSSTGFTWPLQGQIVNGWSLDCATDRGHRGIDIATEPGEPVVAAGGGSVSFTGYTPAEGGGITIAITHEGGLRSTYLHLQSANVVNGQQVSSGDIIGSADGTPLHFGLKMPGARDEYFNPLDYLPGVLDTVDRESAEADAVSTKAASLAPPVITPAPVAPPETVAAVPAPATEKLPSPLAEAPIAPAAAIDVQLSRFRAESPALAYFPTPVVAGRAATQVAGGLPMMQANGKLTGTATGATSWNIPRSISATSGTVSTKAAPARPRSGLLAMGFGLALVLALAAAGNLSAGDERKPDVPCNDFSLAATPGLLE